MKCTKCGKEPEPVTDMASAVRAARVDGICLGCKVLEFEVRLALIEAGLGDSK